MTFHDYLATRRITDTPQGDFVKDARRDPEMAQINSWPELCEHLEGCWADRDVIRAARLVWRGYEAARP